MGSIVEINDTLKIKSDSNQSLVGKLSLDDEIDFSVQGKRLYNLYPSRVYLVEEIEGKWNYLGHAMINTMTIDARNDLTNGKASIVLIYPEDYRKKVNEFEPPKGKNYLL